MIVHAVSREGDPCVDDDMTFRVSDGSSARRSSARGRDDQLPMSSSKSLVLPGVVHGECGREPHIPCLTNLTRLIVLQISF